MIDLNITLLIQLVNFLVCVFMLNKLIIGPVLDVMNKRRGITDGLKEDARSLRQSSGDKLSDYEARIAKARMDVAALREQGKANGQKDSQAKLETAGNEARRIKQEAAGRVAEESESARKALEAKVDDFAQLALSKLLG